MAGMEVILPEFLNKDLPAKERSQGLIDWAGVPLTVAGIYTTNPVLTAAGLIAGMHTMRAKGNGVPMQQGDNGDYFGANGERTKIDELAGRVTGDNR